MAAPQASTAVPPLPVLSHANDILGFLLSSLDDAAEDLCKAVILSLVFAACAHAAALACGRRTAVAAAHDGDDTTHARLQRVMCPRRRGRSLLAWLLLPSTQVALVAVLLAFPIVNQWGDAVGDSAQSVQNTVRVRLGYAPQPVRPKRAAPPDVPFVATVVDDLVEDAFKAACVSAHVWFGMVLAAGVGGLDGVLVAHGADGAVAHGALVGAKLLVAVGTPAGEYGACDAYADALGDAAQRAMLRLLRPGADTGTPSASGGKRKDTDEAPTVGRGQGEAPHGHDAAVGQRQPPGTHRDEHSVPVSKRDVDAGQARNVDHRRPPHGKVYGQRRGTTRGKAGRKSGGRSRRGS